MTISYSNDASNAKFSTFTKLLLRWRGSIWKSVLVELPFWLVGYLVLSVIYRCFLLDDQKRAFEQICLMFYQYMDYIPLNFVLSFYVSIIFTRWLVFLNHVGWIDTPALQISVHILGKNDDVRRIRRNIVRYMIFTQVLIYRSISRSVFKRFPTLEHLVETGFVTPGELDQFNKFREKDTKLWLPIEWAFKLLREAYEKKMIHGEQIYKGLIDTVGTFRSTVINLWIYDWVPIPLVYTQVVVLGVHTYFLCALFGRQFLDHTEVQLKATPYAETLDIYIPVFTIFQYFFYVGWLKVAEVMLNPLGEDDDDFECNKILDRNLHVGLSIVDAADEDIPIQENDPFWNEEYAVPKIKIPNGSPFEEFEKKSILHECIRNFNLGYIFRRKNFY